MIAPLFPCTSHEALVDLLDHELLKLLDTHTASRPFRIAMSGGSVLFCIEIIKKYAIKFPLEIYSVDERYVPYDHPDSNARVISEYLVGTNIVLSPFPYLDSPRESALAYAHILAHISLDLVVLGCGPDGHTGSIFPDDTHLDTDELCYSTYTETFAVRDRMTMSLSYIASARAVWLIMEGEKNERYIPSSLIELQVSKNIQHERYWICLRQISFRVLLRF